MGKRSIIVPKEVPFYEDWMKAVIEALSIPRENDSFIYFAECEGYLKIGYSGRPRSRVASYEGASPFEVKLIGIALGDERHEAALHQAFAHLHHRKEWFVCTEQARMLISFVCGDWTVYRDFKPFDPTLPPYMWRRQKVVILPESMSPLGSTNLRSTTTWFLRGLKNKKKSTVQLLKNTSV